jgi:hypothetical protein
MALQQSLRRRWIAGSNPAKTLQRRCPRRRLRPGRKRVATGVSTSYV